MSIKTVKYFTTRPSLTFKDRYLVCPHNHMTFPLQGGGNYTLAPSRVLDISYGDYLRLIKSLFPNDVDIWTSGFPVSLWKPGHTLDKWVEMLNKTLTLIMWESEEEINDNRKK